MRHQKGFTLIELLVVIAIIAILAALLLPTLARAKMDSYNIKCLSNKKQMQLAWMMYCQDNNENCPDNHDYNDHGVYSPPIPPGTPSWCEGWLSWAYNSPPDENTNNDLLINPKFSLLGQYVANQLAVFRCPCDTYASPPQRSHGYSSRNRSIAMDGNVGGGEKYEFSGMTPAWGPPFTNAITKTGNFTSPGASMSWVFMDEHPDWIDDAILYINPAETNGVGEFLEIPGTLHNNACGISFADGHGEIHKWVDSKINVPVLYSYQHNQGPVGMTFTASAPSKDLAWMAQRTPHQ